MNGELNHQAALRYIDAGFDVTLLKPGTKIPAFSNWQTRGGFSRSELDYWYKRTAFNIAILLGTEVNGKFLMAVDCDRWDMRAFALELGIDSNFVTRTQKGFHLLMTTTLKRTSIIKWNSPQGKVPLDILFGPRCVVAAPSWRSDVEFRYTTESFARIDQLPAFPDHLVREEPKPVVVPVVTEVSDDRAMRYVDRIPPAIQGQSGSSQTIKALLKILSLVGGDLDRAWPLACYYSRRCQPPWDEEAEKGADSLRRKLHEAKRYWDQRR